MNKDWSLLFMVVVHTVSAQDCFKNFAEVEKALLDNSENAYQIANAFFRPRTEGETLCVTAYYYLGLNSTEEDKSSCPSVTSNEDGVVSGYSKWKWCINTFYMDLNLVQLQIFSFFAIYERVSEIELRIPPLCSDIMNEHLLRVTTSLRLYAEGTGSLGEGRPFVGYAARYNAPNELEPLNKDINQDSLDILFDSAHILNSEFNKVDAVFLLISLLTLPTFVAPLCSLLFLNLLKNKQRQINKIPANLFPFVVGIVATSISGIVLMLLFQVAGFQRGGPWYYVIPYSWLWTLIVIQFVTSFVLTYKFMSSTLKQMRIGDYCLRPSFWLQSFALWVVFTAALLLSWHAVFIMLGFILNPFRTILLTAVYTIGTVCMVVFFSVIFSFVQLIYATCRMRKCHCYFAIIYFLLMVAILTFIISYISFLFRTNIGGNNKTGADSVTDWANHLLPPLFLLTLTWILKKLINFSRELDKTDEDTTEDACFSHTETTI